MPRLSVQRHRRYKPAGAAFSVRSPDLEAVAGRIRGMRSAFAALAATSLGLALPAAAGTPGERHEPAGPAEPDGMLVLAVLSPERAMVADPRTGATTARELPGGTLCHGPLLVTGGRVVMFDVHRRELVPRSLPLVPDGSAKPLGRADTALASSDAGRVWLGRYTWVDDKHGWISLREVGTAGRVTARMRIPLARWAWPVAVVDGGLLTNRGRGIVLRRPQGPRVRIANGWPLAADGHRFAWCPRGCRRLGVWSPTSAQLLDPPRGLRPDERGEPAFSPDGSRLALPVRTPAGSRVAVVDLDRGAWHVVRGSRLGDYRATAWSPSGGWLYFAGRGERLLASRDGVAPPVRLPIRTGGTVMSIASRPVREFVQVDRKSSGRSGESLRSGSEGPDRFER
jgi:hypothetical protein